MPLIHTSSSPVVLRLNRDLVRTIKRGHPWVYQDALRELPRAPAGSLAVLLDNRKRQAVAHGIYDPECPVALRICETDPEIRLDDRWAERRLRAALGLRKSLSTSSATTGYRLINGEGDQLPGLVVDRYGGAGVMKRDGDGPVGFWNAQEIGEWLSQECQFQHLIERPKERGGSARALVGRLPESPLEFLENGLRFTADVVRGQKTGFFFDQRDNRHFIRQWSKDARVLNLFSYTGGFSVAAGVGGASHVTSLDVAPAAIEAAEDHWERNGLSKEQHDGVVSDAFEFLTDANRRKQKWDLVILDPPSFAPNRESVPNAMSAYQNLIEQGARVTTNQGTLAVASCSSHIDLPMFLECCEEGISKARRRGTVIEIGGQPFDHPTPLALPEFRYLKFVAMRID